MASGQEIAVAYISLVPSMKGAQGNIAREFGAVTAAADKAGGQAGSRWGRALNAGVKAATAAATTVVAAGGVAMGAALTKGLGRLNAIDTAKAKLRGLGNDADSTAAIMKNATAAVKGTSFGLDAAATTAAGAVAAGIKPGQQLEATLKTVANAAAASGGSMEDMGAIFNKVAATGKAYTENLNQLADRGIPIYQALATNLGVTTDEVKKMASEGKIDFATFEKAASDAAGTVAEEMGKTLPGSLANAGASISRIGANLWKGLELDDGSYTGIYSKLTDLVQAITNALGPVEDIASKVGDAVGEKLGPAFDFVTGKLNAFADGSDNLKGKFGPLLSALAPAGAMFAALGAGGLVPLISKLGPLAGLLGPLPKMLGAIGGPAGIAAAGLLALTHVDPGQMMSGFTTILGKIPELFNGMTRQIIKFSVNVIPDIVNAISTNLPILVQGVTSIIGAVVAQLGQMLPILIGAGVTLFQGLVSSISDVLPSVISALIGLVNQLVPVLLGLVPTLVTAALELFQALVQGLMGIVEPLVQGILDLLPLIVETLISLVPQLVEGALQLFMALIDGLLLIVPPLLEAVYALLPEILDALVSMLPVFIDGAVQLFMGLVQALPIILPQLIDAVVNLIPVIVETLISMIDTLLQGAVELFTAIVDALPEIIPALLQAVADLGPQLVQAVLDLIPQLFQAGKDLLGGLINGIKDMAGGAVDAIKGVGGNILDGVKGFFGIHSPSTVMADIGGYLDAGLAGGLGKGASSVAAMTATSKQITAVTDNLKNSVTATAQAVGQQVNAIIASLQRLVSMMSGAFRNGVTTQLTQVAALFQTVVPNAAKLMQSQTQNSLRGLQTWVGGSFKSALVSAVNAIKAAFVAVPGAVSSSWGRIRSGTAGPSNYVISTVYMNGIRSAVNAIARAVGVSANMPAVRSIGYATGGVLPGYTPGRDIYDFYSPQFGRLRLSGGEGILRPEVVKALGGAATINAWNQSRGRGVGSVGDRGYANGGILDFLKKGSNGWSVNTSPMGFQFQALDRPKDTINQLVANPAREYANRAGGGQFGQSAGAGFVNIAGAYAAVFAKAVEKIAGGGTGLVAAARKALGVPYVWGGSSIPPGLDCSGLVYWAYQQMGKTNVPRLTAAGYQNVAMPVAQPRAGDVAFWGNPAHHIAIMTGANSIVHAPKPGDVVRNAAIYGNPTFGRLKYDRGGLLPPGLTLVENRTGKPEPVFTGSQWDMLSSALSGRGGRSGQFVLVVDEAGGFRELARGEIEEVLGPVSSGALMSRNGVG
ncbi:tape measure protein [Actinomycetaceae bacterium WB03_NA08]|uniref:Tape measure protein n=1 Tax=Scrofimicrobium canadense TaxID=2652290 RepID=A0A6N7W4Z0_9ACTO|nr:tape measure protein [Scrofimicrobium canadense]MSS84481.1 tape measure protein [Scrofimicrobium canadense]